MHTVLASRISHFYSLWGQRILGKFVLWVWGLIGVVSFVRDEVLPSFGVEPHRYVSMIPHLTFIWWLLITSILVSALILESSYRHSRRLFSAKDIEVLCRGMFIGNTFMYKAELVVCARYSGRFKIEMLRNTFTEIPALAPPNSWAEIKVEFYNGHKVGDFKFVLLDASNKERPIDDLYARQYALLDSNSKFYLKLVHADAYEIDEAATVQIVLKSWTK